MLGSQNRKTSQWCIKNLLNVRWYLIWSSDFYPQPSSLTKAWERQFNLLNKNQIPPQIKRDSIIKKNEICILYWELDRHSLLDEGYIYLSTSQNRRTYMYYAVHDKVLSRNECYIICKIQVQPTYICRNFVWLTESRFKTFISKSFHWVLLKPYRINITLVFGHPPPHIKSRNWAFLSRLCCNKSIQRWKSGYCIMTTQKKRRSLHPWNLYIPWSANPGHV